MEQSWTQLWSESLPRLKSIEMWISTLWVSWRHNAKLGNRTSRTKCCPDTQASDQWKARVLQDSFRHRRLTRWSLSKLLEPNFWSASNRSRQSYSRRPWRHQWRGFEWYIENRRKPRANSSRTKRAIDWSADLHALLKTERSANQLRNHDCNLDGDLVQLHTDTVLGEHVWKHLS